MSLKFNKATVHLTQHDIEEAIRMMVGPQGYSCGKVTLTCHPAQYNGPDSFSATIEVEPRRYEGDGQDEPIAREDRQ